jgi:hypothetical protein
LRQGLCQQLLLVLLHKGLCQQLLQLLLHQGLHRTLPNGLWLWQQGLHQQQGLWQLLLLLLLLRHCCPNITP